MIVTMGCVPTYMAIQAEVWMTKDLNKVMIIGRLGTDPELRYTGNGRPVTTFRVAAIRQWRDSSGDLREEIEWFNIVTWNKLAEICHQHLSRHTRVYLEGRLQTRSWDDVQTGQTRYKTEIVAHDMIVLDNRAIRDMDTYPDIDASDTAHESPVISPNRAATYQQHDSYNERTSYLASLDIGDEDIPF